MNELQQERHTPTDNVSEDNLDESLEVLRPIESVRESVEKLSKDVLQNLSLTSYTRAQLCKLYMFVNQELLRWNTYTIAVYTSGESEYSARASISSYVEKSSSMYQAIHGLNEKLHHCKGSLNYLRERLSEFLPEAKLGLTPQVYKPIGSFTLNEILVQIQERRKNPTASLTIAVDRLVLFEYDGDQR